MLVKCFSLIENNAELFSDAKELITSKLSLGSAEDFEECSSQTELLIALSTALNDYETLIVTVSPTQYLSFKTDFLTALELESAVSPAVSSVLSRHYGDSQLIEQHSIMPVGCVEIPSFDGLFSGFYIEAAGQYIVLLPLDYDRLEFMLDGTVFPFVDYSMEDISSVSPPPAPRPDAHRVTVPIEQISAAKLAADTLHSASMTVAFPATPASEYIRLALKSAPDTEDVFRFTPHIEDRGDQNPKEYAARIAKISREFSNSDLGASLSNIFEETNADGDKEMYAYICVCDNDKAIVRKLYANPGESISDLLIDAANELLTLIKTTTDDIYANRIAPVAPVSDNAIDEDDENKEQADDEIEERPVASMGKPGLIVAIVILGIALVVCILFGLKYTGVFGSADTTTTTQETVPDTTVYIPPTTISLITAVDGSETLNLSSTVTESTTENTPVASTRSSGGTRTTARRTTEAPRVTQAPTEAPTEAPTTEAPTTAAPTTEAPTTEAPTEAPTEETPSENTDIQ